MYNFVFQAPTLTHSSSLNRARYLRNPAICCTQPPPSTSSAREAEDREYSAATAAAATFVLKRAARGYINRSQRPNASTVTEAIKQLEREQNRNKVKIDLQGLYGLWRLVVVGSRKSSLPFANDLYFPLRAEQRFVKEGEEGDGVFYNTVLLLGGWISFCVWGPFRWVEKGNRMEFVVNRVRFKIGSWSTVQEQEGEPLANRKTKDVPFFKFICIRDDIMAARGRSGGLALYTRQSSDTDK